MPVESDHHGIRMWREEKSPCNQNCAYILLGLGVHQIRDGASVAAPGWGACGTITYPSGVSLTFHNKRVWVLRPLGYKDSPTKALAAVTADLLGVPEVGDFILYISSGQYHAQDVPSQAKAMGLNASIVCIDPKIKGEMHDITKRPVALAMVKSASSARCLGAIISIRCRTWSAALWLTDSKGRPGEPYRDDENVLGRIIADGTPDPAAE